LRGLLSWQTNSKEGVGRTHFGDKEKARSCRGKKGGLLERLRKGLRKTRELLEFGVIFAGRKVDEELLEELEERLIRADIGVKTAEQLVEELRKEAIRKNIKTWEELLPVLRRSY
jgi:fused signal recognition particle receptor